MYFFLFGNTNSICIGQQNLIIFFVLNRYMYCGLDNKSVSQEKIVKIG